MHQPEKPLRFLLPTGNDILGMVFYADVVFALCAAVAYEIDESSDWLLVVVGLCGLTIVYAAVKGFQWVGIDGGKVHVVTAASLFRPRSFDVADVTRVAYTTSDAGARQHLVVEVAQGTPGSWRSVDLRGGQRDRQSGIDAPLFVAFMAAVWRVQPGVKVRRLPADYRGALQVERPRASRADHDAASSAPSANARGKSGRRLAKKQSRAKGRATARG